MYPYSLMGVNDQCKICRGFKGTLRLISRIKLTDEEGAEVTFARLRCDVCGDGSRVD
jgi:hypothetical protein